MQEGIEAALADLQRWAREGPDATDLEEQADLVEQIAQHAHETEVGPLDPAVGAPAVLALANRNAAAASES